MTNEQIKAKELAKLLNAFAEGKQLQIEVDGYKWKDYFPNLDTLKVKIYNDEILRVKPETKRIALTMQDMIDRELSGKTMRLSNGDLILSWNDKQIKTLNHHTGYDYLLNHNRTFLDGTPCYKEVDNE